MGLFSHKPKTPKSEPIAEARARDVAAAQRAVMERELLHGAERIARFADAERRLEEVIRAENSVSMAVWEQEEIFRDIAERRRRDAEEVERVRRARVGDTRAEARAREVAAAQLAVLQREVTRGVGRWEGAERRRLEELRRSNQAGAEARAREVADAQRVVMQRAIMTGVGRWEGAERRRLEELRRNEVGAAMRQQEEIWRDIAERRALERSGERASWEGEARPGDDSLPPSYEEALPTYEEALRQGGLS